MSEQIIKCPVCGEPCLANDRGACLDCVALAEKKEEREQAEQVAALEAVTEALKIVAASRRGHRRSSADPYESAMSWLDKKLDRWGWP